MIVFKIQVKEITLDVEKYTKTFNAAMEREVRLAAREWLASVIPTIPVYSGASRGAFLPLGRFLRQAIPISIHPNAMKRKYSPNQVHGVAAGEALGSFAFKTVNHHYGFEFSSGVPQFLTNEFNVGLGSPPLLHSTPWHSIKAGNEAFKTYLLNNLKKKIPKIRDFITIGGVVK
jgi:hypothetical protein